MLWFSGTNQGDPNHGVWNDINCDNVHTGGYVCSYDRNGIIFYKLYYSKTPIEHLVDTYSLTPCSGVVFTFLLKSIIYLLQHAFLLACEMGWQKLEEKCIYFSGQETITSASAGEAKCRSLHSRGHLASIHSRQEHDWIVGKLNLK